ncbi:MAG: VOC family protein [Pseudomonadota bacterium]
MTHGDFIWCDLSAYDPDAAMRFYSDLLGWRWSDEDGSNRLAWLGDQPVASIYQMPQKFIDIGMPSFWMSYIAVDDAAATATKAAELGGKVELGPAALDSESQYALIRDPLGAGFTVIDGQNASPTSQEPGARYGHALFVSDAGAIAPFYEALFGWQFAAYDDGAIRVHHSGEVLFHCHEIPDPAVRGKEQYWAVLFRQHSGGDQVEACGGRVEAQFDLPEGRATLGRDSQKAAFMLIDVAT